ncbi:MAG: sensor histidine kinase [Pigmentiphaga sp.]
MSSAARPDRLRRRRRERARLRRRERFLADAMHQLRNAVGTLATQAAMLGRARSLEEHRDTAHAIEHRLLQLGRFLHQLEQLDNRQATQGGLPVFDAIECARSVVLEFAAQASGQGVDLGWEGEVATAAVPVHGKADEIREALVNLLDNAIRHTPAGGRVDVSVDVSIQACRIRVADQGPGLPPGERRRVFTRFAQGRSGSAGRSQGGLGLDIAQRLAHANDGRIEVGEGLPRSGGGRGLSVAILLKLASDHQAR